MFRLISTVFVFSFLLMSLSLIGQNNIASKQQTDCAVPSPMYGELFKTIPMVSETEPEWVKLMYSATPNFALIESAYESYYNQNPYIKTTHTQNYKHFARIVLNEGYVQENGNIYMPTSTERDLKAKMLKDKYSTLNQNTDRMANWTCIGPFETFDTDGVTYKSSQVNVYTISQSASNPNVLYCASEGGNLFKTTDKALNWTMISPEMVLGGVGAIEVDPTNENRVLMAQGSRVYQTIDGGSNWTIIDDISSLNVTDISINPTNTNVILTAGNKGLRRTTDGGASWSTIITDKCWDIELKTNDFNTVFVAKYNPTKDIAEIWKSTDNGATFVAKVTGWFDPIGGVAQGTSGARIGVTNADPNRLYVVLTGNENDGVDDNNYIGIYRSTDAGESWSTPYDGNGDNLPDNEPGGPYSSDHWCFTHFGLTSTGYNQGFYDLAIDVSDTDPNKFLVGSLNLFKSEDGGITYTPWGGYQCDGCGSGYRHPDIQEIEINGADAWVTTDGGIDYYDVNLDYQQSRTKGVTGSAYWGLGQGWNEDVVTGGRYHNGNGAHHEGYADGQFIALGGGESATGYVNQGENRKVYHSDISGKLIPSTLTGGVSNIPSYSLYPNQSYFATQKSEVVSDPRCWNTLYLGNANKLWKSTNGGNSFDVIGTFGTNTDNKVLGIEVCRANPDILYAVQKVSGGGNVWKSTDAGGSWSQLSLPAATNEMFITTDATDANIIYLALTNGGTNSNKIFKSVNGGSNWTNLTTTALNGESTRGIQVQDGTDGGVYIVTTGSVFYKNNSLDWQLYRNGLPGKINYQAVLPFYRDAKLRLATENVAIWETPFYETSAPIAQPMVSTQESFCIRDTVYFEDYSIRASGATWLWSFSPVPIYVDDLTNRNPKVIFGADGSFSATLTVTDANGTDTKTVTDIVTITNECDPDIYPGNSMICASNGDYATLPDLGLSTNTITFSAWIKPDGAQPDYSGIVFNDGTSAGLNFRSGGLAYHWPGGQWWWNSGLTVPQNEWSHVAMVVTPTGITVYLNGESASQNFTAGVVDFGSMKLGSYKGWTSRNFKGQVDEVCIYDRSLSQSEIRDLRHLTKVPTDDASLIHYYQFNRADGLITDKVGSTHCSLFGGATRMTSTAPVGGGTSNTINVNTAGIKDFVGTDLVMDFPSGGTLPDGDLVVSRLVVGPDVPVGENPVPPNGYWIVNNYGSNATFTELNSITFNGLSGIDVSNNGSFNSLFKRASNAEGTTWAEIDEADMASNNSLTFSTNNSITSFSQLSISSRIALPLDWAHFNVTKTRSNEVDIEWGTFNEINVSHFEIERSNDGLSFEFLGKVDAQNNTSNTYDLLDSNPTLGANYYRIKQIDIDGAYTYSKIKSININQGKNEIVLYPNPLKTNTDLIINSTFDTRLKVEIFSSEGKQVHLSFVEGGKGSVDLGQLPSGSYFYRVQSDTFMQNGVLVIMN